MFFTLLQDGMPLKVPTHKAQQHKFLNVLIPRKVRDIVDDCDLLLLVDYSLTMLDVALLSVFVEWWHKDTSSFNRPFGAMMIT